MKKINFDENICISLLKNFDDACKIVGKRNKYKIDKSSILIIMILMNLNEKKKIYITLRHLSSLLNNKIINIRRIIILLYNYNIIGIERTSETITTDCNFDFNEDLILECYKSLTNTPKETLDKLVNIYKELKALSASNQIKEDLMEMFENKPSLNKRNMHNNVLNIFHDLDND